MPFVTVPDGTRLYYVNFDMKLVASWQLLC